MLPEEAQARILELVQPGPLDAVPLEHAAGHALAVEARAEENLPAFPQSAMDGYAIACPGGAPRGARFLLAGESRAGGELPAPISKGQATRIFTGAPVPGGATLIAMQEVVTLDGAQIELREPVEDARFVRPAGSDVKAGEVALDAGTWLGPAALSLLRALGIREVTVHRQPRVALVASGDELCLDPAARRPGQVLESSSIGIQAALGHEGLALASAGVARDTREAHRAALGAALESSDFVLVTGGVSVGDYDLVRPTLKELGVETIFWRVKQQPGGPLYFGRKGATFVFGLPGNPASTLVCFYQHVLPAVRRFLGRNEVRLPRVPARLEREIKNMSGRTRFIRARVAPAADGVLAVTPDPQQDSHTLRSFARCNSLAVIPAGQELAPAGATVQCDLLPGVFA